jgi:hypothetical protein
MARSRAPRRVERRALRSLGNSRLSWRIRPQIGLVLDGQHAWVTVFSLSSPGQVARSVSPREVGGDHLAAPAAADTVKHAPPPPRHCRVGLAGHPDGAAVGVDGARTIRQAEAEADAGRAVAAAAVEPSRRVAAGRAGDPGRPYRRTYDRLPSCGADRPRAPVAGVGPYLTAFSERLRITCSSAIGSPSVSRPRRRAGRPRSDAAAIGEQLDVGGRAAAPATPIEGLPGQRGRGWSGLWRLWRI